MLVEVLRPGTPWNSLLCVIVVLGLILAGLYSLMERRRLNVPWYDDIYDDPVACAHLYKERLKRRDSLWIYTSYFLCAGLGMVISTGGSYDSEDRIYSAIFVGLFLLVIPPLILQVRRNNLRRIEEIDALLAERAEGKSMTLVRRLALRILNWVVCLASPERREWAEGLEREVAFIESDWRALGWAIGSVRVLFTAPESRDATLADVRTAARTISRRAGKEQDPLRTYASPINWGWVAAAGRNQRGAARGVLRSYPDVGVLGGFYRGGSCIACAQEQ